MFLAACGAHEELAAALRVDLVTVCVPALDPARETFAAAGIAVDRQKGGRARLAQFGEILSAFVLAARQPVASAGAKWFDRPIHWLDLDGARVGITGEN
jgi:hypothetical protein